MSRILALPSIPVKPTRVSPPFPAPFGSGILPDDRRPVSRVDRPAPAVMTWRDDIPHLLDGLGYAPAVVDRAVAFISRNRRLRGFPGVGPYHASRVDAQLTRWESAEADDAIRAGLASRRPTAEGRGLTKQEHARLTSAENAARYETEGRAVANDHETAAMVGEACRQARREELRAVLRDRRKPAPVPKGFVDARGLYCPSDFEEAWLTGHVTDADLAIVGAVG